MILEPNPDLAYLISNSLRLAASYERGWFVTLPSGRRAWCTDEPILPLAVRPTDVPDGEEEGLS